MTPRPENVVYIWSCSGCFVVIVCDIPSLPLGKGGWAAQAFDKTVQLAFRKTAIPQGRNHHGASFTPSQVSSAQLNRRNPLVASTWPPTHKFKWGYPPPWILAFWGLCLSKWWLKGKQPQLLTLITPRNRQNNDPML